MTAKPIALPLVLLLCGASIAAADLTGSWQLKEATTSYTINHPLKTATGVSRTAKGLVRCGKSTCDALIAVEVKTFDSGDSNRDLHMLETVRGALHPLLSVRSRFAPQANATGELMADLEVEFAGEKSTVRGVTLRLQPLAAGTLRVSGTFVIRLSNFRINRPSLLGMAVKDDLPIEFSSVWHK